MLAQFRIYGFGSYCVCYVFGKKPYWFLCIEGVIKKGCWSVLEYYFAYWRFWYLLFSLGGKKFPGEIHLVHWNNKVSFFKWMFFTVDSIISSWISDSLWNQGFPVESVIPCGTSDSLWNQRFPYLVQHSNHTLLACLNDMILNFIN